MDVHALQLRPGPMDQRAVATSALDDHRCGS
jgi:hypothetical protein